jgi:polyisoprenoid-binding protein YceI
MTSAESETKSLSDTFVIDGKRSRFTVRAFAGGMLSALGHNPTIAIRDFDGNIHFSPGRLENASLSLSIKADSLRVSDEVSDKDRQEIERQMRDDVLEISKYPRIVFDTTGVIGEGIFAGQYKLEISGKLSLHGVTRDCTIPCRLIVSEDSLRANGEFSLLQTDYRIKLVSAVAGTIKLKDELKFSFDIVAHKKAA